MPLIMVADLYKEEESRVYNTCIALSRDASACNFFV